MKTFVCICLFAVLATALALPHDSSEEHYSTKYDDFNYVELFHNDRLLDNYIDCLLDKGKCTAEGKELKSHVKEALENDCKKCNAKQKEIVEKVIAHLVKYKNGPWNNLVDKYDPEHKYSQKYEVKLDELKKQ